MIIKQNTISGTVSQIKLINSKTCYLFIKFCSQKIQQATVYMVESSLDNIDFVNWFRCSLSSKN